MKSIQEDAPNSLGSLGSQWSWLCQSDESSERSKSSHALQAQSSLKGPPGAFKNLGSGPRYYDAVMGEKESSLQLSSQTQELGGQRSAVWCGSSGSGSTLSSWGSLRHLWSQMLKYRSLPLKVQKMPQTSNLPQALLIVINRSLLRKARNYHDLVIQTY